MHFYKSSKTKNMHSQEINFNLKKDVIIFIQLVRSKNVNILDPTPLPFSAIKPIQQNPKQTSRFLSKKIQCFIFQENNPKPLFLCNTLAYNLQQILKVCYFFKKKHFFPTTNIVKKILTKRIFVEFHYKQKATLTGCFIFNIGKEKML